MNRKQHKFHGNWITSEEFFNLKGLNVFHRQLDKTEINGQAPKNSHILFRNKFYATKSSPIFIYISADDYYKLYINGNFVCQGPVAGYHFHYYYNKVDISAYIHDGTNTIAVHTYYQGLINRVWESGDDRHGFICDIVQGKNILLSSDENFVYSYHKGFSQIGKFGYDTQFAEQYISGTESENFHTSDYDDSTWLNAKVKKYVDYELYEQPVKMLEFEKIKPQSIFYDENGVTIDFGAMYVGTFVAETTGKNGQTLELLFAQELNNDNTVRYKLRCNCDYREEWILSGKHDILNEFDYKSFRYVRINGTENTKINNIFLVARHYPFELKAHPAITDEKLIPVWDLCVQTIKYGVQDVIQDCMDREKGFYLGDGCISVLAHAVITKDTSMIKFLINEALRTSVINKGLMTCMCCSFMQEIAEYPLYIPYLAYSYYKLTGDKDYLKEIYRPLCDVLDFYKDNYTNSYGLLSNLDKWCVVEWPANYRDGYDADITEGKICTDIHNAINAHYIGAVKYINKIAKLIDFSEYCDEKPLKQSYINAFFDDEQKLFKDNINSYHISVPSNAFALMYDLFPDSESESNAVSFIEKKGITSVMFYSGYAILCGLKRLGKTELIYKFIADENAWLKMISENATRTFEGWSKDSKWNTSLFHLTLTYPLIFLTCWENVK